MIKTGNKVVENNNNFVFSSDFLKILYKWIQETFYYFLLILR